VTDLLIDANASNTSGPQAQSQEPAGPAIRATDEAGDAAGLDWALGTFVAKAETQAIRRALERTGWNRKQAARLLKISYRGLLYKMHNNGITQPQ